MKLRIKRHITLNAEREHSRPVSSTVSWAKSCNIICLACDSRSSKPQRGNFNPHRQKEAL